MTPSSTIIPSDLRVALLGTGALGAAVGKLLLDCGFTVTVFNRTAQKTEKLVQEGALACPTPVEAASSANYVLTVVTDVDALHSVLFGVGGALEHEWQGRAIIDLGTHSPGKLAVLGRLVANRGVGFIEAPVT